MKDFFNLVKIYFYNSANIAVNTIIILFAKLWVFAVGAQAVKETAGYSKVYGYIPGILTGLIAWFLFFNFVP